MNVGDGARATMVRAPLPAIQGPEEEEADLYVSRAPKGGFVTLHLFKGCWREPGIDILNYEWVSSVEDYPGVHRCRDCWPAGWTAEKLTTEILAGRRPASRREDARRARDERDTTDESSSTDVEAVRQARRGAMDEKRRQSADQLKEDYLTQKRNATRTESRRGRRRASSSG